ncbi:5-formyltetrahydrofolate cyclo-ligase [Candidatus Accumulibacter aalborgensis]|uniref:5-formyltetrahydrofolate cyclo-ligase n=1 Tax=Candidatus Accumulibacter aalborgensis TaxID=1860102 RepID=A0A1A8XDX1_9PROT|nr:5-formyltetrahydrofolate cyclo-ligase [Candidatus Accumulibacter aalborgensis]SBT03399.1 5-formyltetrahydrofolate cyclo-ligase [Candidatus Accumulibacter aalborgensis]
MAAELTPGIAAENFGSACLTDRRALRRTLLARRLALPSAEWAQLSCRVCAHLRAGFPQLSAMTVGFCWPLNHEPDLRPLIEGWVNERRKGFRALLPVVVAADQALAFRAWTPGTVMFADRYGIPTPASGDFLIPEVLLLPVNGFDSAGYRIGYGGGHFDRTLASLRPRPLAVGVGFELARLASILPQPHDQPLDAMVTEAGVFRPCR